MFAGRPNGDVMKAKFSPGDMSLSEAKRWARKWVEHRNRLGLVPRGFLWALVNRAAYEDKYLKPYCYSRYVDEKGCRVFSVARHVLCERDM